MTRLVWVTALAAVLLAGAQAGASPRPLDVNAMQWTVAQPRIVLGETASVDVTLTATTPDGAALDVAPPRLAISAGSVSAPMRVGPGQWTMTFTPPQEAFPHVAILSATIETAAASVVGFTSLHLWGKGETAVKTKPKSRVTVFIGNESFGPVAADASGVARVPIIVPPGPEHAVASSVDDVGNESQKSIDLGVPPFNRLAMIALDDVASSDGAARLLVFVVDKKGEPLYEAKLNAKASSGEAGAPEGVAPGMFRVLLRPGAGAKQATVDVTLEGARESKASASVDVISGTPARASLDSDTSVLTADEPRAVTVDVRLFDKAGNPVSAQAASIDVDYGRIDHIAALQGGRRVSWLIPPEVTRERAVISVRAPSGEVIGKREVALLSGKPARLVFEATDTVVADGQSAVELRMRLFDRAGNALVPTGARIFVDEKDGYVFAATVDGKLYRARYVPTPRDRTEFVQVKGTVGPLATEHQVRLAPRPRARLLVGVGAMTGFNYADIVAAGPELSLLVRLPGLDGSAHAGLSLALHQSLSAPGGIDHRAFPVYVEAAWRPLLSPDFGFHVGTAGGVVFSDEFDVDVRAVHAAVGGQLVLGVAYRLGPGFVEVNGRAGWAQPVTGGLVPLGASATLAYRFGL